MSETLEMTAQAALSSLSGGDRLYADSGGTLRPVSFETLLKAVREGLAMEMTTPLTLNGGEWVRVARTTKSTSAFILVVSHVWGGGKPVSLVAAVSAVKSVSGDGCFAEQITKDAWFAETTTGNAGLSFPALRFVNDNGFLWVEVQFKNPGTTTAVYAGLGASLNAELVAPAISPALDSDILKVVQFGGGYNEALLYAGCRLDGGRRAA